ncbi:MAG: hypothetical protein IPP74_11100 [Alphaproteobacteria bacterium]|nr:hypothetical protein [Alphaproteobacteria bacterium]
MQPHPEKPLENKNLTIVEELRNRLYDFIVTSEDDSDKAWAQKLRVINQLCKVIELETKLRDRDGSKDLEIVSPLDLNQEDKNIIERFKVTLARC